MARYRVFVLAHRRSARMKQLTTLPHGHDVQHTQCAQQCSAQPAAYERSVGSGVIEMRIVRAHSAAIARDLALEQLMADSALQTEAAMVVDAVRVERLRLGRRPAREDAQLPPALDAPERVSLATRAAIGISHARARIART